MLSLTQIHFHLLLSHFLFFFFFSFYIFTLLVALSPRLKHYFFGCLVYSASFQLKIKRLKVPSFVTDTWEGYMKMTKVLHNDKIHVPVGSSFPFKALSQPGRDDSPVSVITHSALISQPSSACTSMEHHIYQEVNKNQSFQDHRESTSDDDGFYANGGALPQECLKVGTLVSLPETHSLFLHISPKKKRCEVEEAIIDNANPDLHVPALESDYQFPSKARVHLFGSPDKNGRAVLSKDETTGSETEHGSGLPQQAKCLNKSTSVRPSSRVVMAEEGPKKRYGSQSAAMAMVRTCKSPGTPSMDPSRSSFSGMQNSVHSHFIGVNESKGSYGLLDYIPGQMTKPGMQLKGLPSKWEDAEKWLHNNIKDSPSHPKSRVSAATGAKSFHNGKKVTNIHASVATSTEGSEMGGAVMPMNWSSHNTASDSELPTPTREYRVLVRSASQKIRQGVQMARNSRGKQQGALFRRDCSPVWKGEDQAFAGRRQSSESLTEDKYADVVESSGRRGPNLPQQDGEFVVQASLHGRSASMKDATTEISPTVSRRDMATQITPLSSVPTSRSVTPIKNESPARHNTPTKKSASCNNAPSINLQELESCQLAKLQLRSLPAGSSQFGSFDKNMSNNWSTREEEEEESFKCLNDALEARAAAWEETERIKYSAKLAREEARIEAWENHQKAKAEAELRKLEVKLEKMRSHATEKIMNKLASAHRRAEEMRACAEAQHAEQIAKASERAVQIQRNGWPTSPSPATTVPETPPRPQQQQPTTPKRRWLRKLKLVSLDLASPL